MQIQDVFQRYGADLHQVETYMERHLEADVHLIPEIIHHIMTSGGKRFRPLLLLVASDLCGYGGKRRYPMAAVIEFIHTATLLHDDVIDHAEMRRGKVSANNIWGNAASVLVGDFLLATSFKLLSMEGNLPIMKLLSQTTTTMAEGEVFQLVKSHDLGITEREYLKIVEKKTAILISAACAVGALLAEAAEEEVAALTRFGMRLGSAFQITDDTLDYLGNEEEFGKARGQDLKEGKITLPLIRTLKRCSAKEKNFIRTAVAKKDEAVFLEIVRLLQKYDGIEYALNKARTFIVEAKDYLKVFGDSEAKEALFTICDYILCRRS